MAKRSMLAAAFCAAVFAGGSYGLPKGAPGTLGLCKGGTGER